MFKYNFILLLRNFRRFKSTLTINLIGLSTGLACTLIIYLWVQDELKMDKFHEKDSSLYQLMENREQAHGIWTAETNSVPMGEALKKDMPEVEYAIERTSTNKVMLTVGKKDIKAEGTYVGVDFFNTFSYNLIKGNKSEVLRDKKSIVLSEGLALKLFNTTRNLEGKTIIINHDKPFIVTGVFANIPRYSSFKADFLLSFEEFKTFDWVSKDFYSTGISLYLLLKDGTNIQNFNKKIAGYIKLKTNNEVIHRTLFVRLYSDAYLYGNYENGVQSGGRITYVKLFSLIALFILIIACINFMNLSTAKAAERIKEIGIKKAIGAQRSSIILQYLVESMTIAFVAFVIAGALIFFFLPHFNDITGKQITLHFNSGTVLTFLGITIFTGFAAGSYPAIFLSKFNPALILKGQLKNSPQELWTRKGLVVFQFALSIMLIVSVLVVQNQIKFVQSKDLGYEKDNILVLEREGKLWDYENLKTFISEVKEIPGIKNASSIDHNMTGHNSGTYGVSWPSKDSENRTEFENVTVNYEMMEVLGIKMKDGRTFSSDFKTDTSSIIFNEAGIEFMGLKDPIGKVVKLWGEDRTIIGVARNFNFESLHTKIKPLFFRLNPQGTSLLMVHLAKGKEKEAINHLQQFHSKFNPGFDLNFRFLDEDYQEQYKAEQQVASLSKYFAGLAILISCLGLLGLAAFSASRRTKEIGIRKVLGSSVFGIIYLLSKDFSKLVFISIVISLPISYWLASRWLQNFAYSMSLPWWYFLGAGLISLVIAWLTVSSQAIKAANINPVKSLKEN